MRWPWPPDEVPYWDFRNDDGSINLPTMIHSLNFVDPRHVLTPEPKPSHKDQHMDLPGTPFGEVVIPQQNMKTYDIAIQLAQQHTAALWNEVYAELSKDMIESIRNYVNPFTIDDLQTAMDPRLGP